MRRSVHLIIPTLLLALGLLAPLDAEARFNLRGRLTKASSWLKARTSSKFKGFRKAAPAPKMITAPKSGASKSRASKASTRAATKASARAASGDILTGYMSLGYKPTKKDLVVVYRVEPKGRTPIKKVAEALAAESSIGTWTAISTVNPAAASRLRPKVYSISKRGKRAHYVKIAYPQDLFEAGNMPQILSAVAGNIFGMKDVKRLRLVDIAFSEQMLKKLPGPAFGIEGVRKKAGVTDRPMVGTIVKPKVGLNPKEHAKVAKDAWVGGLDLVKDDENLSSMSFNKFNVRMKETFKALKQAQRETGHKKTYVPNVTAGTSEEMIKRAKLVKKLGGTTVMVDIVTAGWAGVGSLRAANLGLVLHGHRAGHAMMTRDKTMGMSMLTMAKVARAVGIDQLHVGTAGVGKMHGQAREVSRIQEAITQKTLKGNAIYLKQDWGKMKTTLPIASGGLHPGQMSKLVDRMGTNIVAQFGGGCHGHPDGTVKGAMAIRQALDAKMTGVGLRDYAKGHAELNRAIQKFGTN
jgi:ribulose-bisphosphate carboxylase large chain